MKYFIVPIGVKVEDNLFPYQKVIHTFESIGEETIAIEQGKEISKSISIENKNCER